MGWNARAVLFLVVLAVAGPGSAQDHASAAAARLNQDSYRFAVAEERRSVFPANIGLTPDERFRFWEIYDEYEKERGRLENERFALLSRYAQSESALSDSAEFALASAACKLQLQEPAAAQVRRPPSAQVAGRVGLSSMPAPSTIRWRGRSKPPGSRPSGPPTARCGC